jgi:hypothetical protein
MISYPVAANVKLPRTSLNSVNPIIYFPDMERIIFMISLRNCS